MKIFLPTDFSDCSKKACVFAASHLPEDFVFTLIHAIHTPQAGATLLINLDEELRSVARENMESLVKELEFIFPAIEFKSIIKFGSVNQVVNEIVSADDLIVVGTTGASGINSVIGSNTSGLIRYAKCPLICIPDSVNPLKQLNKAMFSTDFKNDASIKQLDKLEKLLSILRLKIEVLH
ncbi:MAG TPA: universal stress protein, partial [Taishania sp.]|nr:universal stress protein [Taishania sp.]